MNSTDIPVAEINPVTNPAPSSNPPEAGEGKEEGEGGREGEGAGVEKKGGGVTRAVGAVVGGMVVDVAPAAASSIVPSPADDDDDRDGDNGDDDDEDDDDDVAAGPDGVNGAASDSDDDDDDDDDASTAVDDNADAASTSLVADDDIDAVADDISAMADPGSTSADDDDPSLNTKPVAADAEVLPEGATAVSEGAVVASGASEGVKTGEAVASRPGADGVVGLGAGLGATLPARAREFFFEVWTGGAADIASALSCGGGSGGGDPEMVPARAETTDGTDSVVVRPTNRACCVPSTIPSNCVMKARVPAGVSPPMVERAWLIVSGSSSTAGEESASSTSAGRGERASRPGTAAAAAALALTPADFGGGDSANAMSGAATRNSAAATGVAERKVSTAVVVDRVLSTDADALPEAVRASTATAASTAIAVSTAATARGTSATNDAVLSSECMALPPLAEKPLPSRAVPRQSASSGSHPTLPIRQLKNPANSAFPAQASGNPEGSASRRHTLAPAPLQSVSPRPPPPRLAPPSS